MIMNEHEKLFVDLKSLNVDQFKSFISASQYLISYNLVKKYCNQSDKVLDWGTGNGHFSYFLVKQGFNVVAFTLENESQVSKYLTTKYPERYRLIIDPKSVKKLPFEDNIFDFIVSVGVLEHVHETGGDELESLIEIKRMLKPGGVFICVHLPNKYSWIASLTKHIKNKHQHLYKYSSKDIKNMTAKADLELIENRTYGIFPRLMFGKYQTSPFVTNIFNFTDTILSFMLSLFCQNHCFVARKKS